MNAKKVQIKMQICRCILALIGKSYGKKHAKMLKEEKQFFMQGRTGMDTAILHNHVNYSFNRCANGCTLSSFDSHYGSTLACFFQHETFLSCVTTTAFLLLGILAGVTYARKDGNLCMSAHSKLYLVTEYGQLELETL